MKKFLLMHLLFWLGLIADAGADPFKLTYTGQLVDATGQVQGGPVDLDLSFFRMETGGDAVLSSAESFTGVALVDGVFQLSLDLTAAEYHQVFTGKDDVWVQVTDVTNNVVYPRQLYKAVPYALKVPIDGSTITFNGSGQLSAIPPAATGVQSISVGTGLTGGGSSGTVTVGVDVGTTANKIVQLDSAGKLPAVDGSNLTNLPSSGSAPSGNAGGGLTGTYPNPTLANDAVSSATIIDGAVGSTDLAAGAVNQQAIATGAVGSDALQTDSVGAAELASGVVSSTHITDGTIVAVDIADSSITGSKLVDASVSGDKISAGTITSFASTGIDDNSSATVLTINSSNKAGLGTSSPDELVHVSTAVDGTSTMVLLENSQAHADGSTNETAELAFGFGGNNDVVKIVAGKESDYDGGTGEEDSFLAFYTEADNSVLERMRISSAGNVGIATASPAAKLHVEGIIRAQQVCDETGSNCKDISSGWGSGGDLVASNNLSDVGNAGTARTNLGVAIGSDVQAYDAGLNSIAGLTTAGDKMIYTTASDTYATTPLTAAGRDLLDDANASAQRTTLGLAIGSDVQGYDAGLNSIAGLTTAGDKMIYTTASDTYATANLTAVGRDLLDDASVAAQRTTLGLAIGTDVQAHDNSLDSISGLTTAADKMIYTTASDTYATTALTAAGRDLIDDATAAAQRTTLGLGSVDNVDVKATYTMDDGTYLGVEEIRARDTDGLKLHDDGTFGLFVKDGGRVAIGSNIAHTSPDYGLHIKGPVATDSSVYIERNAGAAMRLYSDNSTGFLGTATNHNLKISTNSTVRMTFDTSGNVGIGTNAPAATLDVAGDVNLDGDANRNFTVKRHTTGNTAGSDLVVEAGGATSSATDKNAGSLILKGGIATGTGESKIEFWTATPGGSGTTDRSPTLKMTLNGKGLGVGIGSADELLHVGTSTDGAQTMMVLGNSEAHASTSINETAELNFGFGGDNDAVVLVAGKSADYTVAGNKDSFLAFHTENNDGTTEKMRLTAEGYLGLGSASPNAPLHIVDGGSNAKMYVEKSAGAKLQIKSESSESRISTVDSHKLHLGTNLTDRMTLDTNGSIGIGTTTPDSKLHIDGGAICVTTDDNCAGSTGGYVYAENTTVQSADYAEYFFGEEKLQPGDVVGLNRISGKVRLYQSGDQLLGIVSTSPGVVGNAALADQEDVVLVALLGQVPVQPGQVVRQEGLILTEDGKLLGYSLASGEVYIKIADHLSTNSMQELVRANQKLAKSQAEMAAEIQQLRQQNDRIRRYLCERDSDSPLCH